MKLYLDGEKVVDMLGRVHPPRGVQLYDDEIDEVREMLAAAEAEYDTALTPEEAQVIRDNWRARILSRWPRLTDYCFIFSKARPPGFMTAAQILRAYRR